MINVCVINFGVSILPKSRFSLTPGIYKANTGHKSHPSSPINFRQKKLIWGIIMDRVENQRNSQNRTFSLFSSLHSGLVWLPMPSHHLKRGQQLLNLRFISHYSRGRICKSKTIPKFPMKKRFPYSVSLLFVLLCSNITSVSWFLPFMKKLKVFFCLWEFN